MSMVFRRRDLKRRPAATGDDRRHLLGFGIAGGTSTDRSNRPDPLRQHAAALSAAAGGAGRMSFLRLSLQKARQFHVLYLQSLPQVRALEITMGRPARYIPDNENGALVEISCRCIGGRALLAPAPNPHKFNEIVAGVLGRALEVSPLDLCSAIFSSNHHHILAVVHEQQVLSRFMAHAVAATAVPRPIFGATIFGGDRSARIAGVEHRLTGIEVCAVEVEAPGVRADLIQAL